MIEQNMTILFQGDSITDAGRIKDHPGHLGNGYAMMASALYAARHPEHHVTFLNRGISGNRTKDLVQRWDEDCIALKPDVVSIMIGINNIWRRFDSNDPTELSQFESEYRSLLERVTTELSARIILVDPFLLPIPEDRIAWREHLDPMLEVVAKLAGEFHALHIPLDRHFQELILRQPDLAYWAPDGVHPTVAGHGFIADTWLRYVVGD